MSLNLRKPAASFAWRIAFLLLVPASACVFAQTTSTSSASTAAQHTTTKHSHRRKTHHASSVHTAQIAHTSAHTTIYHVTSSSHLHAAHYAAHSVHALATPSHHTAAHLVRANTRHLRHGSGSRYITPSFVSEQGVGDITTGEDQTVRAAAIAALGNIHGTAVVIDASTGRILAMVNQKMALAPGAEPCSTIKLTVGMAALSEGLTTRDRMVNLGGFRMNLTEALAHSNNLYFEEMGRELGFERVHHYARLFGLGELAGYNIPGEQLGVYPDHAIPASEGGVGRMCSFGQGVSLTPLQLGAYVAAIANDGTLYSLQHPTTPQQIASFRPRIKRALPIAHFIPDMQDGMAGSVEYGTARSLRLSFRELPVFGKTGTCSNLGTRFGWFTSYSDSPRGTLVTVFLLEGGRDLYGPLAAGMTGKFYRALWDRHYFDNSAPLEATAPMPSGSRPGR